MADTQLLLGLSFALFALGLVGVMVRRNALVMLMCMELMLNGAAINFVAFNKYLYPGQPNGQLFALFLIAVAACEVALAIAIVINLYRKIKAVDVEQVNTLKH